MYIINNSTLLISYFDHLLLFTADKGEQKTNEASTEAPSGGKDVTTPTAVPQSRVKVEPPLVEDILRYPIEVFVSAGEPFVHPNSKCFVPIASMLAVVISAG